MVGSVGGGLPELVPRPSPLSGGDSHRSAASPSPWMLLEKQKSFHVLQGILPGARGHVFLFCSGSPL